MLGLASTDLRSDVAAAAPLPFEGGYLCQDGIVGTSEPSSFKERGAEVLLAACALRGVESVVADSSGNAGVAVARAAERRGIQAHVVVPESTPGAKLEAMRAHHAEVEIVAGDREAAHERARSLARQTVYASHIFQPFFHAGVASLSWELALALDDRLPRELYVPVGNGSLLLGMILGWRTLTDTRLAGSPILHAVQLSGYATLASNDRSQAASGAGAEPPRAAGVAIVHPPRLPDIKAAVTAHEGDVTVVDDAEIVSAREDLERLGIRCDPTGAVAYTGWRKGKVAGDGEALVLVTSRL